MHDDKQQPATPEQGEGLDGGRGGTLQKNKKPQDPVSEERGGARWECIMQQQHCPPAAAAGAADMMSCPGEVPLTYFPASSPQLPKPGDPAALEEGRHAEPWNYVSKGAGHGSEGYLQPLEQKHKIKPRNTAYPSPQLSTGTPLHPNDVSSALETRHHGH